MIGNGDLRIPPWFGRVTTAILLAVLGYLAVEIRADVKDLRSEVRDHARRLTILETDIGYIKQGIDEIKQAVKR